MPNEDEDKSTHTHPLPETARTLEEQLFDAKDATLRLWERNRQLHYRVGGLERRVRGLTWLTLGLLLGSTGLIALLVQSQVVPLQRQVVALQETVNPLPARIEEVAETMMARANPAAATSDDAHGTQVEQEVREAIQKLAPDLLAPAGTESGQGRAVTEGGGSLLSATVGAATGPTGAPVRLVVGRTDPHTTPWVQYNHGGIYVDIDTSSAGFAATPYYFTSLSGHTNNWMAQGVTSIYLPTATGFRVHVGYRELTAAQANSWGWSLSWLAIGN
jgi:hypothetical protein